MCIWSYIHTDTCTHTYTHTPKKLSVIELEFIAETEPQSGWRISFSFRGNYWKEEWPPKLLLPAMWLPACLPSMEEAFPDINHNFLHLHWQVWSQPTLLQEMSHSHEKPAFCDGDKGDEGQAQHRVGRCIFNDGTEALLRYLAIIVTGAVVIQVLRGFGWDGKEMRKAQPRSPWALQ